MAKKKGRYGKRLKRRRANANIITNLKDCHHILWQKNKWSSGYLYKIRNYDYCKIYIPRDTLHRYIHSNLAGIPAPRDIDAKSALEQLGYLRERGAISESDPLEKRLLVLIALFDYVAQPTADALKRQLQLVHGYESPP